MPSLLQRLVEGLRYPAAVLCFVVSDECHRIAARSAWIGYRLRARAASLARTRCHVCHQSRLSVNALGVCSARCQSIANARPVVICATCRTGIALRFDWRQKQYTATCCGQQSALSVTQLLKDL